MVHETWEPTSTVVTGLTVPLAVTKVERFPRSTLAVLYFSADHSF